MNKSTIVKYRKFDWIKSLFLIKTLQITTFSHRTTKDPTIEINFTQDQPKFAPKKNSRVNYIDFMRNSHLKCCSYFIVL